MQEGTGAGDINKAISKICMSLDAEIGLCRVSYRFFRSQGDVEVDVDRDLAESAKSHHTRLHVTQ